MSNKQLCTDYAEIAGQAGTEPTTTEHLMQLREFMEKAEVSRLPLLEMQVADTRKMQDFLMDNTQLTRYERSLRGCLLQAPC